MKLNYDCVREVLLTAEQLCSLDDDMLFTPLTLGDFAAVISDHSERDVFYTLLKLSEAQYITTFDNRNDKNGYSPGNYFIKDITYKGHEYLSTVRNNGIWRDIKKRLPVLTLSLVEKVGASLITAELLP